MEVARRRPSTGQGTPAVDADSPRQRGLAGVYYQVRYAGGATCQEDGEQPGHRERRSQTGRSAGPVSYQSIPLRTEL